ncbi:MAG: hypothetical protein TE42_01865 [Candidatus Synechococcus spongiarum SP3]|uniref:Uncharacterized protein n=1 Tax=Candidatus Synechococcus spongiarum SP3 TaxID=1604020 RepID=A0A0G2J5G8_9SYNE|nr:MAG: hypothetical protein TE42_01865 [Candidatus Synechococcus spongiarum SP3]
MQTLPGLQRLTTLTCLFTKLPKMILHEIITLRDAKFLLAKSINIRHLINFEAYSVQSWKLILDH